MSLASSWNDIWTMYTILPHRRYPADSIGSASAQPSVNQHPYHHHHPARTIPLLPLQTSPCEVACLGLSWEFPLCSQHSLCQPLHKKAVMEPEQEIISPATPILLSCAPWHVRRGWRCWLEHARQVIGWWRWGQVQSLLPSPVYCWSQHKKSPWEIYCAVAAFSRVLSFTSRTHIS